MTRLEFIRRSKRLTQIGLATELGYVSSAPISRLETYAVRPDQISKRLTRSLEEFFDTSITELLEPVEIQ
jgi:transcriptional regulator with XRE-family HTH domain